MKRINCCRVQAIEFNSSNTIQQHQPTYKDIINIFFYNKTKLSSRANT